MTAWKNQRDKALNEYSRPFAEGAKLDFRAVKAKQLDAVRLERHTKRQAMDAMRRQYEKLRAKYLGITGTTYQAWLDFGPAAEWDECIAASRDDAVWDRLVERGLAELEKGPKR
jgi:hypothetical protein